MKLSSTRQSRAPQKITACSKDPANRFRRATLSKHSVFQRSGGMSRTTPDQLMPPMVIAGSRQPIAQQ